ncbi:MAG: tyrosine-type recombinase/integrase [Bacillota bacterium]
MGLTALLALQCRLRQSECLALRRTDINMDERILTMRDSIPIPEIVIDALGKAREKSNSDLVFPAASGKMMTQNGFQNAWGRYRKYLSHQATGNLQASETNELAFHTLRETAEKMCKPPLSDRIRNNGVYFVL